ncbi:DUF2975 domain-containing protein [Bacillaceae bacterium SIJ1]|uniref:DUF2975 domain-containing protein n=1 Tax=Litoribacterium kuwaitense TaxID=1398745 RepID=UPI0013EA7547|nr:DUF2975 domain-containing protein [Litoribacterium kuwaitense]NGP45522.1 DUF2975 domain-containing protein [Litoribacterium kuwaitense]
MKQGSTLFLKITIFIIAFTVVALCLFYLPWFASDLAAMNPDYAYLQYPILIGVYGTVIPFYFALYQAYKLLNFIDQHTAFSELAVKALERIKIAAFMICAFYVAGCVFLLLQQALHPGVALPGFVIIFATVVIAVFTAVLQKLLRHALDIKQENDLTV